MKSAYEKALEKIGPISELSDAQKEALAEIDKNLQAKTAELELMNRSRINAKETAAERARAEDELRRDIQKLKDKAEVQKDKIRQG